MKFKVLLAVLGILAIVLAAAIFGLKRNSAVRTNWLKFELERRAIFVKSIIDKGSDRYNLEGVSFGTKSVYFARIEKIEATVDLLAFYQGGACAINDITSQRIEIVEKLLPKTDIYNSARAEFPEPFLFKDVFLANRFCMTKNGFEIREARSSARSESGDFEILSSSSGFAVRVTNGSAKGFEETHAVVNNDPSITLKKDGMTVSWQLNTKVVHFEKFKYSFENKQIEFTGDIDPMLNPNAKNFKVKGIFEVAEGKYVTPCGGTNKTNPDWAEIRPDKDRQEKNICIASSLSSETSLGFVRLPIDFAPTSILPFVIAAYKSEAAVTISNQSAVVDQQHPGDIRPERTVIAFSPNVLFHADNVRVTGDEVVSPWSPADASQETISVAGDYSLQLGMHTNVRYLHTFQNPNVLEIGRSLGPGTIYDTVFVPDQKLLYCSPPIGVLSGKDCRPVVRLIVMEPDIDWGRQNDIALGVKIIKEVAPVGLAYDTKRKLFLFSVKYRTHRGKLPGILVYDLGKNKLSHIMPASVGSAEIDDLNYDQVNDRLLILTGSKVLSVDPVTYKTVEEAEFNQFAAALKPPQSVFRTFQVLAHEGRAYVLSDEVRDHILQMNFKSKSAREYPVKIKSLLGPEHDPLGTFVREFPFGFPEGPKDPKSMIEEKICYARITDHYKMTYYVHDWKGSLIVMYASGSIRSILRIPKMTRKMSLLLLSAPKMNFTLGGEGVSNLDFIYLSEGSEVSWEDGRAPATPPIIVRNVAGTIPKLDSCTVGKSAILRAIAAWNKIGRVSQFTAGAHQAIRQ